MTAWIIPFQTFWGWCWYLCAEFISGITSNIKKILGQIIYWIVCYSISTSTAINYAIQGIASSVNYRSAWISFSHWVLPYFARDPIKETGVSTRTEPMARLQEIHGERHKPPYQAPNNKEWGGRNKEKYILDI